MISPFRAFGILASAVALSACDPAFETTAELCASGNSAPVIIGLNFSNPSNSPYTVAASRDGYPLYLLDILEAAEPANNANLDAEQQLALSNIKTFINDSAQFNLAYEQASGNVSQASNPLDFVEYLIATTDDTKVVGAFQTAKTQVASGIVADDSFCIYSNRNIRFVDENSQDKLFAELSLSYDPFQKVVQQTVIMSEVQDQLNSSNRRAVAPYIGFYQAAASDFVSEGYSPTRTRQAILNNADGNKSLVIDDGNDNQLGQVEMTFRNSVCQDANSQTTQCPSGTTTRPPAKNQCNGTADNSIDETGVIETRSFALNSTETNLKRMRLETDFSKTPVQVRVYTSDYIEAIYDTDGTTIIKDPTNCEKQAVLTELANANPGQGVRLTTVPDPTYDITRDANNEVIEPTPAFSFDGTSLQSRPARPK